VRGFTGTINAFKSDKPRTVHGVIDPVRPCRVEIC
jgi:hypothetical protein